ncbi:MAG TPA: SHOCT domain-containing protein [Oscillatoriaceae cyanobacterium]
MALTVVSWLVVIVLVAWAVIRLWPRPADFGANEPDRDVLLQQLRERYARGEIDHAEFLQGLEDLTPKP